MVQQQSRLIGVVAAVLGEQFRHDLVGRRVDRQVELPPGAPLADAVLPDLPFPFAEDLQAGAVDHHVDRPCVWRTSSEIPNFAARLASDVKSGIAMSAPISLANDRPKPLVWR